MTGALVRYDAACRAIDAAWAVDEVLEIRDRAAALRAYARQAGNRRLESDAADIRFRAERRIGELMAAQRDTIGLASGRRTDLGPKPTQVPTLAEAGIGKHLADRARKYAAIPHETFEALLAERRQAVERENARITVDLVAAGDKAERRAAREAALGARLTALPDRRYGVILADPEWRFEPRSRETGMDRAADNHYPTSPLAVILARDVAAIAAPDCVLFLWATVPMLPEALAVMDAWGFGYRSNFAWGKDRIGPGYWNRNRHEHLLVGTRGAVPAPAPGTQWDSLLEAPRAGHSAKPDRFLELIEAYFPNLPKIELNRRGPARPGWDAWGNEAEQEEARCDAARGNEIGAAA